ncbi:MAG: hypothetical protein IJR07_07705 [Bacteroidaceae bacterium]|jgi:hypothetical protein|nr:hypothetical protein [Bacteroidaceae bacterium]
MSNQQNNISLESIAQQKAAILKRINAQKQKMSSLSQGFIEPWKPTTKKSSAALGLFNKGLMVVDGVVLGLKLLKRLRKMLR